MEKRSTISVLNETFRGYRRHVAILVVLAFVSAVLDGISINAIVPLVSFLLGGSSLPTDAISQFLSHVFGIFGIPFTFRYLLTLIAALFVARAIVLAAFTYMRGSINANYLISEVRGLYHSALGATWAHMLRQKGGYVQNTVFWDAKRTAQLLDGVVQFIQSSTGALIYLAVAVNISPIMTGITVVAGAVILIFFRPLVRKTRTYGEETSETEKMLAHHISEQLQGFKSVKAAGVAEEVGRIAEEPLSRMRNALTKAVFVQGLGGVIIQPLSFLFIIGIFAFSYSSGSFNIAAFAATLYLIQKIFVYLESTQGSIHSVTQLVPFAENILRFKKEAVANRENEEGAKPFVLKRAIELKDVSLSHKGRGNVLSHVSCEIRKGTTFAIVGRSGGGKTTLADILLRLFRPSEGELLLDGVHAEQVRLSQWRRRIAYVAQDPFLMNASVTENVRFYDPTITDKAIETAARAAHIYEDIKRLPEKFDTRIGDRGVTLSGGQRQRVALARALARKPEVLVLDEVTSSLDSALEREIQKVINELRGTITLVVIAHRISTVVNADRLAVLENGSIVAEGKPSEMLKDPQSYLSRMRDLQRGDA